MFPQKKKKAGTGAERRAEADRPFMLNRIRAARLGLHASAGKRLVGTKGLKGGGLSNAGRLF